VARAEGALELSTSTGGNTTEVMRSTGLHTALLVLLICVVEAWGASRAVAAQKFRADEWVTQCDSAPGAGAPDCSITVPFWQTRGAPRGSFALVVLLQTGNIGIVGEPFPTRAVLRIDKNPPIECREARYCVFPSVQALAALKQLKVGSLVLIDVYTEKGEFSFSLTPKGFQAGMAQIRAWGYRTE
jgi:hypothetical protein